jgi:hypothetical protein
MGMRQPATILYQSCPLVFQSAAERSFFARSRRVQLAEDALVPTLGLCKDPFTMNRETINFGRIQLTISEQGIEMCWTNGTLFHPLGAYPDLEQALDGVERSQHDIVQKQDLDQFAAYAKANGCNLSRMGPKGYEEFREK